MISEKQRNNRALKEGGRTITVLKPFATRLLHIGINWRFVECNDGWFQVLDDKGVECFFRVSSDFLKQHQQFL